MIGTLDLDYKGVTVQKERFHRIYRVRRQSVSYRNYWQKDVNRSIMASDMVSPPVDGAKPSKPTSSLHTAPRSRRLPKLKDSKKTPDGDSSDQFIATDGERLKIDQLLLNDQRSNKVEFSVQSTHARYPRISRPVELMRTSYDIVVIGSGYGGGVAASRMARGRQSVCLLERGKEKWPGEYPEELPDALKELHVSGQFAPWRTKGKWVEEGDPTGLYHMVVGEGQNAFVGNGLGGTSLLNANVFLEADQQVLNMNSWPAELKDEAAWKKCMLFLFFFFPQQASVGIFRTMCSSFEITFTCYFSAALADKKDMDRKS